MDFKKITTSKKQGFSLIELLVVVVLIMVLGSIGFVRFQAMQDSTKVAEAQFGLVDFYRLQKTYYITNREYSDTVGKLEFKFHSKDYIVGFYGSYESEKTREKWQIKTKVGGNCVALPLDTDANKFISFQAGSANDSNKLPNWMINEKSCLRKMPADNNCLDLTGADEDEEDKNCISK